MLKRLLRWILHNFCLLNFKNLATCTRQIKHKGTMTETGNKLFHRVLRINNGKERERKKNINENKVQIYYFRKKKRETQNLVFYALILVILSNNICSSGDVLFLLLLFISLSFSPFLSLPPSHSLSGCLTLSKSKGLFNVFIMETKLCVSQHERPLDKSPPIF